jgi:hypothetical protein
MFKKEILILTTITIIGTVFVIGSFNLINVERLSAGGGAATLNQQHYRWRNDDDNEANASWSETEDTPTSSVALGQVIRLRFLVDNTGTDTDRNSKYGLRYGQNADCTTGFQTVPISTACGNAPFCMYDTQLANQISTTNVANGLTDPVGGTFAASSQVDDINYQTANTTIDNDPYWFSEMEYGFQVTANASWGSIYYFGLDNDGSNLNNYNNCARLDTGTAPAVISISITSDGEIDYGSVNWGQQQDTVTLGSTETVENNGDVTVYLEVKTSNALDGTSWTLADSIGSLDEYVHEFSTTTVPTWVKFSTPAGNYKTATTSMAAGTSQNFDFRITAPSETTDYQTKSITITIHAVES